MWGRLGSGRFDQVSGLPRVVAETPAAPLYRSPSRSQCSSNHGSTRTARKPGLNIPPARLTYEDTEKSTETCHNVRQIARNSNQNLNNTVTHNFSVMEAKTLPVLAKRS
jgi:hypothetical protein